MKIEELDSILQRKKEFSPSEGEIERLILGLDENVSPEWQNQLSTVKDGALIMPEVELERREKYKEKLRKIFTMYNINPESVNDSWLKGKIRRILK